MIRRFLLSRRWNSPPTNSSINLANASFKSLGLTTTIKRFRIDTYYDTPERFLAAHPLGPCWLRQCSGQKWEIKHTIYMSAGQPNTFLISAEPREVDHIVRNAFQIDFDRHLRNLDSKDWGLEKMETVETDFSRTTADGVYKVSMNVFRNTNTQQELGTEIWAGREVDLEVNESEGSVNIDRVAIQKVEEDLALWMRKYPYVFGDENSKGPDAGAKYEMWAKDDAELSSLRHA